MGNLQLEDIFLNQLRRDGETVTITTSYSVVIIGTIRGFDNQTIIVDEKNGTQIMLYKHSVISVESAKKILCNEKRNQN